MRGVKQDVPSITAERRAEVEVILQQRTLQPRLRERLEMVKARLLGQEAVTSARWCGRTRRTVGRWLGRYVVGGVAALADGPRSGRPAAADAAYRRALARAVATPPRERGLGFDVWTSARLASYLAEQTGVRLSAGWLRALLTQEDFACRRPKHTLTHLQDAAEVAACQEHLAAAKKKGGRRARALRAAP